MKALFTIVFGLILSVSANGQTIQIYGGSDHDVYLGCLNCNRYDSNSIWNQYGTHGSKYSATSIWNKYGSYGGKYIAYSPFNAYATDPPVLVDPEGNFYGYLTANKYLPKRTEYRLALIVIDNWEIISEDIGDAYQKIFQN